MWKISGNETMLDGTMHVTTRTSCSEFLIRNLYNTWVNLPWFSNVKIERVD